MNKQTATAVALAMVAGVLSLGAVPGVLASHESCHSVFEIADAEILAEERNLAAGGRHVGVEDVLALSGNEVLHVKLVDPGVDGELTWSVFHQPSTSCVQYTAGTGCTSATVLDTPEAEATCVLEAPQSDEKDYFVAFQESRSNNAITYMAWAGPESQ